MEVLRRPRLGRDVDPAGVEGDAQPGRQIPAKRLVGVRRLAQLVVEVGEPDEPGAQTRRQLGQEDTPARSSRRRPTRAATRTSPAPKSACSETVCWTRSRSVDIRRRTARRQRRAAFRVNGAGWCWCRRADSNRRPSAYETLALTT